MSPDDIDLLASATRTLLKKVLRSSAAHDTIVRSVCQREPRYRRRRRVIALLKRGENTWLRVTLNLSGTAVRGKWLRIVVASRHHTSPNKMSN